MREGAGAVPWASGPKWGFLWSDGMGLCSISVINRWKRRCWGWFLASLSLVKGVLVSPSPAGRG